MNKQTTITALLALVALTGWAQLNKTAEVKADSLQLFVQAGDSCMRHYNTFEALKYYQQAYNLAKNRSQGRAVDNLELPLEHLEELPEEKHKSKKNLYNLQELWKENLQGPLHTKYDHTESSENLP